MPSIAVARLSQAASEVQHERSVVTSPEKQDKDAAGRRYASCVSSFVHQNLLFVTDETLLRNWA